MADTANRSRGSGRRVRGAFAPKHDAGTATRHYQAFWQRRCRAAHRAAARRFGAQPTLCGGSWRGDPPERCLSRQAGIMRCCLIAIEHARNDKGLTREDLAERIASPLRTSLILCFVHSQQTATPPMFPTSQKSLPKQPRWKLPCSKSSSKSKKPYANIRTHPFPPNKTKS